MMDFDKNRYKIYTWKNWMNLHWILNPGIAINELFFGLRVPKISLEDRSVDKPRMERSLIPCPHCETLHDGRTWSTENGTGFKNWFGLYCNNCNNIIPCLINIWSLLILALTFPIWVWFGRNLKAKWLKNQPQRYKKIEIDQTPNSYDQNNWVKTGLGFGVFLFLLNFILIPLFGELAINIKTISLGLVISFIGGMIFSFSIKMFFQMQPKKTLIK